MDENKIPFSSYQEFKKAVLKSKKGLHDMVEQRLETIFRQLYPDVFVKIESCRGIVGGRADMIVYWKEKAIHIEFIASKERVHDNIKCLKESQWNIKLVILMDDEIDPGVADKYFDELRYLDLSLDHFPRFKLSDVLLKDKEEEFKEKLKKLLERPPGLYNQTPPEPNFVGRKKMLEAITEWYNDPNVRIGALIGWGGVGKSALVRKWYDSLSENNIHPDGIFWWGFYRNAYLDAFLNALLKYTSRGEIDPEAIKSSYQKVERIKEYLHKGSYLIILDGFEQMQKGESGNEFGKMKYNELTELLCYLADAPVSGLCLITTRFPLKDIERWHNQGYKSLELVDLSIPDALAMLKKRGVKGDDSAIIEVIKRYKGHALSLTSVAGFLKRYYEGDIDKAPDIRFVLSDEERFKNVHKLFQRYTEKMSPEELCFLKIFSLFRGEVTEQEFKGVFRHDMGFNEPLLKMNELDFKDLVDGLVEWRLISFDETKGSYTTHPLIKGFFDDTFNEKDKKLCHKRIYQYFGEIAKDEPATLEEMQPLFEQVYHGCKAGMYQETWDVYYQKVQRRRERFLVRKLGAWETALSLVQNFFEDEDFQKEPLVTKIGNKGYLINEAGLSMMMLGRLKEAEGLHKKGIEFNISQRDWMNASMGYQNLAVLQILTGNLLEARKSSEEAIQFSRKVKNIRYECASTASLAYILFLLGKMKKAGIEFKKANELKRKYDPPGYLYFYSLRDIRYADLLLAEGKIQASLEVILENLLTCERNNWINSINLCHRSLAAIYRHLKDFQEAEANAISALEGARKTGRQDIEVQSLIELARIKLDQGQYKEAESIINQALRICQRCGYRLYEIDAELVLAKVYFGLEDKARTISLAQSAYEKADAIHYHWPKVEAERLLKNFSEKKKVVSNKV